MTGNDNKQITLEAIAEFTNGGAWNQTEYSDHGVPVVRVTDIKNETVDLSDCKFLPKSSLGRYARHALRAGDLVICTVGSHPTQPGSVVGRSAVMPQSVHGALLNQNAVCIRSSSPDVDQGWLGYLGRSREFHDYIINRARGSANQVRMAIGLLKEMPIEVPPLAVQRRIAGILSAYDELMENSQRRIRLLEAMARALYREWFVHFRFPGHEKHPRVASPLGDIPQGWEVKPFSAIASYVNGYPFKPAQLGTEGKPIIKIKELKAGIVTDTPRNLGDEIPEKYNIHDGDVLFSWSADLDTYLWMGGEGLLNQHLFNVVPFDGISRAFCFHALKGSMPRFRALSLGATMHHIKRSALDQVFTLLPPAPLRKRFEVLVEPMHQQLITLTKHVENLRRTRDLLLPRLLSGQVEISTVATISSTNESNRSLSSEPTSTAHRKHIL